MLTPQQIEQVSFAKATFGGYNMQEVDALLQPLTQDYIALFKENAILKNKMKVLVEKLDEYRQNEASIKETIANAQKTADAMVMEAEEKSSKMLSETEEKCTKLVNESNAILAENARNADAIIAIEEARAEAAKMLAYNKISEIQDKISSCLDALDKIKNTNRPNRLDAVAGATDSERGNLGEDKTGAFVNEITANLAALVGTTNDSTPVSEPKHSVNDSPTSKFSNLQFGRNYDPTKH